MKKHLLLLLVPIALMSCSKSEGNAVAIDMTLKTYSADANYGKFPATLQLNFEASGNVKLISAPYEDVVTLKYDVGDKNASTTTLHIYGQLDKTLYADGLTQGTKIDWNTEISRLSYKPGIVGFTAGGYHFISN